jgi:hypothetical protein
MGFFSWKTQDTNKSITNVHSETGSFPVYMHDNNGNVYLEMEYNGYGVFGGVDYYVLLAQMNGLEDREQAISFSCNKETKDIIKHPNLTETKDWQWRNEEPESCLNQGFFMEEDDEDRDGDDDDNDEEEAWRREAGL